MRLATLASIALLCANVRAQEFDVSRWSRHGTVRADAHGLTLGDGPSSISTNIKAGPLHILYVAIELNSTPASGLGRLRAQCLDKKGHVVMDLNATTDPKAAHSKPGLYFKTHAYTSTVRISVENAGKGEIQIGKFEFQDDDRDRKDVPSNVNAALCLRPIWSPGTVFNETVLMQQGADGHVTGHLLYKPTTPVVMRDYGLARAFTEGTDFTVTGQTIVAADHTKMPYVKPTDFEQGDLKWYDLRGKHVVVTYEHAEAWDGPTPIGQAVYLPNTVRLLKGKKAVLVVATGDSITLGVGTSAFSQMPPFMPTWPELAVQGLKSEYGNPKVKLYNVAVGGMTSDWGADTSVSAVASLRPDLVIIAFGMNDFWWMPADRFQENVRKIMASVRNKNPRAEFILVASMRFDPGYAQESQYPERIQGYAPALRSLEGTGVRVLDMTAITGALFARKPPRDYLADPLHPNDFLARWYAQGIVAMLMPR